MRLRTIKTRALIFLCALFLFGAARSADPLILNLSPQNSSDGVARLSWENASRASVLIQRAPTSAFESPTEWYRGSDDASVITGLMNGDYYFRARVLSDSVSQSVWSKPVHLSVQHHSLVQAFAFFAVGLVVFVATSGLILLGLRQQRSEV